MTLSPLIIGHRGASRDAPENTLAAFRLAWEQGADGIETDLRLTKDGHIVCLHDETTGRTADRDIPVADATLAELRSLDVGAWQGPSWRGERVPTLTEMLEQSPPGQYLYLEIKSGPEILPALKEELTGRDFTTHRITLLSFSAALVAECKQALPGFPVGWITDYRRSHHHRAIRPGHREILRTLDKVGADVFASKAHPSLDAEFLAELREASVTVHVWTIDSLFKARLYAELGVDGIVSNRPGWLKARLADDHAP